MSGQAGEGPTADTSKPFVEELGRQCGHPRLEDWWSVPKKGEDGPGAEAEAMTWEMRMAGEAMRGLHAKYNRLQQQEHQMQKAYVTEAVKLKCDLFKVLDDSVMMWRKSRLLHPLARS